MVEAAPTRLPPASVRAIAGRRSARDRRGDRRPAGAFGAPGGDPETCAAATPASGRRSGTVPSPAAALRLDETAPARLRETTRWRVTAPPPRRARCRPAL